MPYTSAFPFPQTKWRSHIAAAVGAVLRGHEETLRPQKGAETGGHSPREEDRLHAHPNTTIKRRTRPSFSL